jgi:HSP20 family protein
MLILNRTSMTTFAHMNNHLSEIFNSVLNETARFSPADAIARSTPPMNVWEESDCFRIEAELPGYTMNDIDVTVLGDEVTIKGERTVTDQPDATYLRRERSGGTFARTWTLPSEVNADQVEATLRDGVLLITLPKHAKALPRKIEVKAPSK